MSKNEISTANNVINIINAARENLDLPNEFHEQNYVANDGGGISIAIA